MTRLDSIRHHFHRQGNIPTGHRIERSGGQAAEAPGLYQDMVELETNGQDLDPAPGSVRARGQFGGAREHTLVGTYSGDENRGQLQIKQSDFEGLEDSPEVFQEAQWSPEGSTFIEYGGAGTDEEWLFAARKEPGSTVIYSLDKSHLDAWLGS